MRYVKVTGLAAMLLVSMLFLTGALCQSGQGAQPTATPTQMATATLTTKPQSTPTATMIVTASPFPTGTSLPVVTPNWSWPGPTATLGPEGCVYDRDAIQDAIYSYNASHGEWPTADGRPGAIIWSKLVNDYLPYHPYTRVHCYWQVNSYPEGEVCVPPEYMC